jgi:hypothetical protein
MAGSVRQEGLVVGGVPGLDVSSAWAFGVELGAEQDREVREPQPTRNTITPPSAP